jgi:hypothetical protein
VFTHNLDNALFFGGVPFGVKYAIFVSSLGAVRLGRDFAGRLRSKSRNFSRVRDRDCPPKRSIPGAFLQETLSLPVFHRHPTGLDKLQIHKGRSGKKLLRAVEE